MADTLDRLQAAIAARRTADPASSYVASLHAKRLPKIAQKLGEEAVETVIAALSGDRQALTGEAADLLFHLLVLLDAQGVPLAQVLAELDRREGISGLAEKASRRLTPTAPALAPEPKPDFTPGKLASGASAPASRRPLIRKG